MNESACLAPQPTRSQSAAKVRRHEADVAIVGGGFAGSLAAVLLARAGVCVTLIDRHAVYPSEFRVEKLAGSQVGLLRRLGVLDGIAAKATRYDQVLNIHRGRVLDRTYGDQYGILYPDLVSVARAQIPASADVVIDRVIDVDAGAERQRLTLASGGTVDARLLVVATGMADVLRQRLGIRRRIVHEKHSVSFGFSIAPAPGSAFAFPALTCYGDKVSDRIDYVNFFPIGYAMRANLFTFIDYRDPWARVLRREPKQALLGVMPGLDRFLGDFRVLDRVDNWIMDLSVVEGHLQDGVVLIGDAFQTSCPAAGTGVFRLLTDVDRLCNEHVPHWLATPGMAVEKIAQFYSDPAKLRADAHSSRLAQYRRSLSIDDGLGWELHRRQAYLRRRLFGWVKGWKAARDRRPAYAASRTAYRLVPRG